MLSNGKCRQCSPGTYLLKAPTQTTSCLTCQISKSTCEGGSEVYPLSGYWRSSTKSDNIMECLNPDACLGGQYPLLNLTGQCAQGYQGILCASCSTGYTLNHQSRECKKCPAIVVNSLILAAFALLALVIIVVLVWSNFKSSSEEKNYLPVYFRILVNHLQVATLVASFDFNWPDEFKTFFKGFKPVAEAQSEIFSVDCLLYYYSHDSDIKPYYVKSIVLFALPPAMIILSVLAWLIIYQKDKVLKKKMINPQDQLDDEGTNRGSSKLDDTDKELVDFDFSANKSEMIGDLAGKIILTIIVILFLLHPTITREMFNLFNCKLIEGIERPYIDLEAICFQGQHSIASNWFGITSLIIYGAGIPFIGFIVIYRNRLILERSFVKQRYGFLYNGYKPGYASYWEIFIIYRKVVIIFIQVYFVQNGKLVQSLMTLLFLGFMMALVKYLQPYNKYCLNQLEFLSLLTSMASVYFCIYFISNKIDPSQIKYGQDSANMIMFLLILFLQLGFFVYWAYQFVQEFKLTVLVRYPRIYSFLCACTKGQSVSLEIEEYKAKIVAPFVEKLQRLEEQIKENRSLYEKGLIPFYDRDLREIANINMQFLAKIQALQKFHSKGALCAEVEDVILDNRALQMRAEKVQHQLSSRYSKLNVFSGNQAMLFEEYKEGSLYGDELTSIIKNQSIKSNSPKSSNKKFFSPNTGALFKIQPIKPAHDYNAEVTNIQADETLHDLRKSSAVYTKKNSLQSQTPLQKKYSSLSGQGVEHSIHEPEFKQETEKESDVVVLQAPQRKKGRKSLESSRKIKQKINSLKIQPNFFVIDELDEDNKITKSKRIVPKRELIRNIVEGKDQEIITRLEEPIIKAQKLEISLMEKSQHVSGIEDSEQ
ncbi:hypothetical protein FGO68_gene4786 [Halteria grandinella]|uniref:DUF7630 domain-containing protein n=1 Tax=Halteria grandinella TaxID=5974 RepID=A0A8J8NHQ1_HALGN|nr:hypothetical protein FGO68_gene4786 [Halteria grandinella]